MSQGLTSKALRALFILVHDIRLLHYVIIFFGTILLFSGLYYFLTPYENGIGNNGEALSNLSFLNALYFSIVTVSSLGYGDMHPMGLSKLIAVCEVLFGLAIMGIMIAKLTSSRI